MLGFTTRALWPGGKRLVEFEAYWLQKWPRHFGKEINLFPLLVVSL
jgi:hypothetical protein